MLFARSISRLARQLFPDVIGNCYVEGEVSGESASNVNPVYIDHNNDREQLDDAIIAPELPIESVEDAFCNFIKDRGIVNSHDWQIYVKLIAEMKDWTIEETLSRMREDPDTNNKFNQWLAKQKKPL
jgi:hypothetical protein